MKATKYTVTIKMEVLSMDVIPSQIKKVLTELYNEHNDGYLATADGDTVAWSTHEEEVEF